MQVAAIQVDVQWEDRPANHARVRALMKNAAIARDTLVVLPEMFDTGFSMATDRTDPGSPSASEAFLRDLAMEHGVAVLASCVARAQGGRFANEAVAFAPDGSQLARYRKQRPFTPPGEHVHYPAGSGHVIFEWQGVKISPFICYDLRFPELFRPAALDGAELFVVVSSWPFMRSEHWVRLLQARAIENLAFVLGVNRCGTDPSFRYDGRSCLFDFMGEQMFQADEREQALLAEVHPHRLRSWREQFPALRDAGSFSVG